MLRVIVMVMVLMVMIRGSVCIEHVHPVENCFQHRREVFLRGLFTAGKIHDQGLAPDAGRAAAQAAAG